MFVQESATQPGNERSAARLAFLFHCVEDALLTGDDFNDYGPLLLDAVFVRNTGIAAVVGLGVVKENIGEVEIPVNTGGHPAVLPHRLHGGEGRLDGPGERPRVRTCSKTRPC